MRSPSLCAETVKLVHKASHKDLSNASIQHTECPSQHAQQVLLQRICVGVGSPGSCWNLSDLAVSRSRSFCHNYKQKMPPLLLQGGRLGCNSLGEAFLLSWRDWQFYALPLTSLILKIKKEKARVILTALTWSRQMWLLYLTHHALYPQINLQQFLNFLSQGAGCLMHPNFGLRSLILPP